MTGKVRRVLADCDDPPDREVKALKLRVELDLLGA